MMQVTEVDNRTYQQLVQTPFCRFNEAAFYALNAHKVDEVKYLLFNDGKNRFALVLGMKDGAAKAPFSSSFEAFSELIPGNKIVHYHEAVAALVEWAKQKGLKSLRIAMPPAWYHISHLTKMENALHVQGFQLTDYDVNFEFYLSNFDEDYEKGIAHNARKNLRKSLKNGLSFERTDDSETVYEVIRQNREEKGYPLWMSYADVLATAEIIPSDYFLVRDSQGEPIAAALVHQINDEVLRVVYWGNTLASNSLCPMNFLSYNVFKYYSCTNFRMVDIGISTEDSLPNYGLCDFKEGIGCKCSAKKSFVLRLN